MQRVALVNLGLFDNQPFFTQGTKDKFNTFDFGTATQGLNGLAGGIGAAVAQADPNNKELIGNGVAVTGSFLNGLGNTAGAF